MRSYLVKENHIGSVVSEILQYKLTYKHIHKQTSCYFIIPSIYLLYSNTLTKLGTKFNQWTVFSKAFLNQHRIRTNLQLFIASYYRQLSADNEINNYKINPVYFPAQWAEEIAKLVLIYFNIHGKLSIIRCLT